MDVKSSGTLEVPENEHLDSGGMAQEQKQVEAKDESSSEELPYLPGCEPDGSAFVQLSTLFPEATRSDIVRFLVARKGDVAKSSEMMENCNRWRQTNLPLKREVATPLVRTNCFFVHGKDREGSPLVIMRGAFYDNRVGSAESFVLLAAHLIDYVLEKSGRLNISVIVHTANIPGAPNLDVDISFLRLLSQVLSDNYPERLKRLVMYPFPWYGRAIWSVAKMFVDRRTQDKIKLYSGGTKGLPSELSEFIDPNEIPSSIGGSYKGPLLDVMETFTS